MTPFNPANEDKDAAITGVTTVSKDDVKEFKPLAWLYFSFGTSIPTATVSAGN